MAVLNNYFFYQFVHGIDLFLPEILRETINLELNKSVTIFCITLECSPYQLSVHILPQIQGCPKRDREWVHSCFSQQFNDRGCKLLHLPNNKEIVLGGLILNGAAFGSITPFIYTEAWRAASVEFPK